MAGKDYPSDRENQGSENREEKGYTGKLAPSGRMGRAGSDQHDQ